MAALASWLVVTQALALAGLPLTLRVFRSLPDRGYGFARVLGLVLVAYLTWLVSMLGFLDFGAMPLIVVALCFAVGCWAALGVSALATIRERWRLFVTFEGLFLAALTAAIFVRSYNADIVGQEKFMDYAFMNAFLSTPTLPAEDPWLSGFAMPYYHLGYLILAVPGRIGLVPGPILYNLAVAFVFAAGFAAAVSIVYALLASPPVPNAIDRSALAFGILGGLMLVALGNLVGPLELIAARGWGDTTFWQIVGVKNLGPVVSPGLLPVDGGWWWRSSRVIANIQPDGITEFPYFSFLLGDLHPHYTAIPLALTIVGLALNRWLIDTAVYEISDLLVSCAFLGLLIGASTWDVPTFWGLLLAVVVLGQWRRHGEVRKLLATLPAVSAPFVLAPVAIWPYFVGYQSQPLGLGIVDERTPLASLLILFGPAFAVLLMFAIWLAGDPPANPSRGSLSVVALAQVALGAAALVLLVPLDGPTLPFLAGLVLLLGVAGAGWMRGIPARDEAVATSAVFTWLLAMAGLLILVAVELVFLRDVFGTRMNTVFKFHYHAWILFALAGATALGLLWRGGGARAPVWRACSALLVAAILVAGLVYPIGATWTKSGQFSGEPTLDGSRFLRRAAPSDLDAIQWLQANAQGRPVIIEAVGPDYQEYARVSTFSGLPTVLGWVGHELQWRGDQPEYGRRQQDIDAIYRAESRSEIQDRAARYGARYLFFGTLERARYGPEVERRLGQLLPLAYDGQRGTVIYQLDADSTVERAR